VYAKNLKLHKGVDNRLQFQFINQEQKPVDITGKNLKIRIISDTGEKLLLTSILVPVLPLTGIAELRLNSSDLVDIDAQGAFYSIEIPDNTFDRPVFVDQSADARGVIRIMDSVLPKYVPAIVKFTHHPTIVTGQTVTYYSDSIASVDNPIVTLQPYFTDFVGTVQIQGSTTGSPGMWYNIGDPYTYPTPDSDPTFTGSDGYIVDGYHPYLQLEVVSTQGDIPKILVR
jgi:hypothetical protein